MLLMANSYNVDHACLRRHKGVPFSLRHDSLNTGTQTHPISSDQVVPRTQQEMQADVHVFPTFPIDINTYTQERSKQFG